MVAAWGEVTSRGRHLRSQTGETWTSKWWSLRLGLRLWLWLSLRLWLGLRLRLGLASLALSGKVEDPFKKDAGTIL